MLSRAQLSVKFSLDRLRFQISEYQEEQFPGDHAGPRRWLAVLGGVLDTADQYLEKSRSQAVPDDEKSRLIRDASNLVCEVYQSINEIKGASISDLPYPVVAPLDRWFFKLGLFNTTVFRAELLANYELKPIGEKKYYGIRDRSPSLDDALTKVKWPIYRVTVPSQAFGILPHFAIVAHEVGHALYSLIQWDVTRADAALKDVATRMAARLGMQTLDTSGRQILAKLAANWFEELAADSFAFYLTGPAIFFSLCEFSSLLGGGGLSFTHPATTLRRRILHEKLQQGNDDSFATLFEKHAGEPLTEAFNSPTMVPPASKEELYNIASQQNVAPNIAAAMIELNEEIYGLHDELYSAIQAYLTPTAPTAIYTPTQYDADLTDHLAPMLAAIPPIETKRDDGTYIPTEFASILNVGWVALLTKLPELRVKTDDEDPFFAKKLEILHDLLLKGVELSEARRVWEQTV